MRATGALREIPAENDVLLITHDAWNTLMQELDQLLSAFHGQTPLRRGVPRGEVRSRLQALLPASQLSVRTFNALLGAAKATEALQADDNFVWRTGFSVQPTLQQQVLVDHLLAAFAQAPYAPPNSQDSLRMLGQDTELLAMLLEQGPVGAHRRRRAAAAR